MTQRTVGKRQTSPTYPSLTVPGGGGETPSPAEFLDDSGGGKNEFSPGNRWLPGGMADMAGGTAAEWPGGGRNGGLETVGFSRESMQNDLLCWSCTENKVNFA